jgi:hypothetical protein
MPNTDLMAKTREYMLHTNDADWGVYIYVYYDENDVLKSVCKDFPNGKCCGPNTGAVENSYLHGFW